ncbi:MAG: hypothetical protein ACFFDW_09670, partial [Candidatus Thorarchaeota archaeon]
MPDKKDKLKTLHVDIYSEDVRDRIEWLKDYSGISSDAELVRWILRELQRRLEEEQKDREAARVALRKTLEKAYLRFTINRNL